MLAAVLWALCCIISRCVAQDKLDANFVAGDVTDDATQGAHTYFVHDGLRVTKDDAFPELQPIDAEPVAQDSPDACMKFCDEEDSCQCAVFLTANKLCQRWRGCRSHPAGFLIDDGADTLMKVPTLRPRYKEHDGFNTHSASGSVDIDRGGHPDRVESYQGCQDRCTVDDTCDCTVYATDGTYRCWKRQHCVDTSLVYDPTYTVYTKEGGARVKLETTTAANLYGWTPPATTTRTTITSTIGAPQEIQTTAKPTTTTKRATTHAATTSTTSTTTEKKTKVEKSTTTSDKPATHAPTTTTSRTTTALPTFAPDERYKITLQVAMPVPKDLLSVEILSDLRRLRSGFPEVNTSDISMLAWRRLRPSRIGPEVLDKLGSELASSKIKAAFATSVSAAMDVAVDKVHVVSVGYGVEDAKLELETSVKYFIPLGSAVSDVEDLVHNIGRDSSLSAKSFKKSLGPNLKAVADSYPKDFPLTAVIAKALLDDGSRLEVVGAHGKSMAPLTFAQRLTRAMTSFFLRFREALIIGGTVLVSFCSLWYIVANYGARGYQRLGAQSRLWGRSIASRLESRSARQLRVRQRVEKYAQKALDLLMAPEPEYQDSELIYLVRVLNRCRIHAKTLCGSPWGQWVKSGDCQTCKRRIDRAEKGLQCASGGHHLCWPCMVSIMDWENLAVQEGDSTWTWATKEWL